MALTMSGERHHHPHEFLGDVILGINDGIATTLVFALSIAGAATSTNTVVLAGLAEMLAGGVSMTLGGFLSAQSQMEAVEHQINVEREEIQNEPEEEREELRQIYRDKGFSGNQLVQIVDHLTSDEERWLNSMVRDELLIRPGEQRRPWSVAGALGLSFILGAFVPLASFVFRFPHPAVLAAILSIAALFFTGAARSRYSRRSWIQGGIQMLIVGLIGTVAAVLIGKLLSAGR